MSDQVKNAFISHIHEDDADLVPLKDLAAREGCTVRDASINSLSPNQAQSPEYIKSEILGPRIRWATVFIVLISSGTHDSEYVNWEIEYAHQQGKSIIGVWAHGAKDSDLPDNFEKYGDHLVGWQGRRIADAIAGKVEPWESTSGAIRATRDISRHDC